MKKRFGVLTASLVVVLSMISLVSCTSTKFADDPLDLVGSLDIDRYLGRWYEIARYQHGFEKTLVGATAEYSLREDGRVQVLNSGFKKTLDGKYTSVKAVAWRPDETVPGALKVKFFGLFTSDYLVFGLDEENYQWALVGNNDRDYLWFLSRTPEVSDDVLARMKEIAEAQGYDLSELYLVPQKER
ncbi:MAG: lipocalin family protein [Sphaerochaetaceae bacterium]|jgi:lipocalin|nr:lipocalin family protein [Sphaerochaetaceae bacterium]NLO61213.1 lipocalin family protein [Spirochaetales bacterium]MDD2406274.1 lipocalin family protein [Sphaerochaetaceae bacterium]MDD3670649.1 lipocalin family protein [Sphaerochaetaceae bacterium]MDD4260239.1 lipocalin family protein [Sphaerochaetaceae bacterium]